MTQIDAVPRMAVFRDRLQALGYRTLEQVTATALVEPDLLAQFLGVTTPELRTALGGLMTQRAAVAPRRRYPLGVRLDRIPRPRRSLMRAPGLVANLPPTQNLVAEMQPIRDQQQRGTCVAHASGAAAEHYWRLQGKIVDLSRQYLYWSCKQHDGDPNGEGTWVAVAMSRLTADGCCREDTWPYVGTPIPNNESQDPPPAAAIAEAPEFKVPVTQQIASTSVLDIKAALAAGHCVAFSIPVFNSWYQNDEVIRTGDLVNPLPNEPDVGGHAMCLVGYEDLPAETALGGGHFYLRNSWGTQWAAQSTLGPGYGTIPYSYIAANCTEAFSIG